jgi:cytochrome c556
MRTRAHRFVTGLALAAAVCLLASPGGAGEKDKVWKPLLPAEAYQQLLKRATKNIEEALRDNPNEDAIKRAQFNALMIAAYSRSTRDGGGVDGLSVRQFALQMVKWIPLAGKRSDARRMANAIERGLIKGGKGLKETLTDPRQAIAELGDVMEHFKTQKKGGEGIHPALQSNIRLKGALNGIEEKLRALAMRKLSDDNLKKEADELALLGYRAAVVGELTYFYTPKKNAKEWQELSLEMRDAGVALADAAKKQDGEAVLKASNNLNSSCNRCHSEFRK